MEYVPCIGNSSYSFWRILLKLYRCFKDGLKICILFFQNPEIIFYHFLRIFNLDIFRHYTTDMYMEYVPCIGNSSYSFWWILLKLYRCFKDGLEICILFFQNPEIIFYHFFRIFNLDIFEPLYYRYVYGVYTLYRQLLLQFLANPFETLQLFSGWSEDMHIVFSGSWNYFFCILT